MLRGDVKRLASALGVSRKVVYYRAQKRGVSLKRIGLRDPNTADMFSGDTVGDEHQAWFNDALQKLSGASNGK